MAVVTLGAGAYFIFSKPAAFQNSPATNLSTYQNSYITGYEGDYERITYFLSYSAGLFAVRSKVTAPSTVTIRNLKNSAINTISFFYNGAAGFSSAKELWENQYEAQCNDCFKIVNAINYPSDDIITHANATDEWVIFAQTPGFVIAHLKKPVSNAIAVVESLAVNSQKTEWQPEFSEIKTYFANEKIKPVTDCKEIIAVKRTILKTPQIATAALELLLDGPSEQEKSEGYISPIPDGSELNSLSIKDGVAYADFSSLTESGGGSCSMTMRVAQIKQTLLQFPTIKDIVLSVDGITDPIFQP